MNRLHLRLAVIASSVVVMCVAAAAGCSDDPPGDLSSSTSSGGSSSGSSTGSSGTSGTPGGPTSYRAKAVIASTADAGDAGDAAGPILSGTADFEETSLSDGGSQTKVTVTISSGTPGDHGLHIHENGSCAATDAGAAQGAGGHWNPLDAGHALPQVGVGHMGDLGNIQINSDGTGKLVQTSSVFTVKPGPYSVVGHAVIYHANQDDGLPPVGNAGPRPGCGVIASQ